MSVTVCYSLIGIRSFDWYQHRWPWMTLNGVVAFVVLYFTEFDRFAGQNWPTLQRGLSATAELVNGKHEFTESAENSFIQYMTISCSCLSNWTIWVGLQRTCAIHIWFLQRCMHCMRRSLAARKLSVCPSVCPSVCRSYAWFVTKWEKVVPTFLYHIKVHLSLFCDKKNGWCGATPNTWNFGSKWPRWSKNAHFQFIFARSASAVTPSEKKVQLTLIGSPIRTFQWADDKHRAFPCALRIGLKT